MKTIKREELKKMIESKEDFLLINVLSKESFDEKHIPGSINIPVKNDDFIKRVEILTGTKTKKIVVYCANFECTASPTAAKKLTEVGFTNVYYYQGGVDDWFQTKKEKKPEMTHSSSCKTCE